MTLSRNGPRTTWKLLVLQVALLLSTQNFFLAVAGQEAAVASQGENGTLDEEHLDAMADAELEAICTTRGFELYREIDEDTGNQYEFTHEDYVEAARQCLAVEREMGEILAEHPELLDELKDEVDSMKAEKTRLEQEIADVEKKRSDVKTEAPPRAFVPEPGDVVEGAEQAGNEPAGDPESHSTTLPLAEGDTADETTVSTEKNETDLADEQLPRAFVHHEQVADVEKVTTETGSEVINATTTATPGEQIDSGEEFAKDAIQSEKAASFAHVDETGASGTSDEAASLTDPSSEEVIDKDMPFLEEFVAEVKRDLKNKRDTLENVVAKAADVVLPKKLRGPLKKILGQFFRIAKQNGISAYEFVNRYIRALLKNVNKRIAEGGSKDETETDTEKPQESLSTSD